MRVLRSSLLVAATAIIAAACGDKVNIVQPGATAGKINSVQVAPSSATMTVGQTLTLTAAVNADAGISATVAWSSSSPAAATVSAAGLVTAVAASSGVAICATASATGVASVVSCGQVVVQAAAVLVPASVQIASITGVNLNTPVAVPPGVVAGQINVSVNVNPGTEKLDSVVVYVTPAGGAAVPAGTQPFTAAQAAALRSAANEAIANQTAIAPIVFSINTAAYNTTTGAVTWLNGSNAISAVAYGKQGGATVPSVSASSSVSLLFGNADGFQATLTNNGNKANDAAGFAWWGNGTVTIAAIPVMYSGKTVGTVTGSLGANTAAGSTCAAGVGAAVSTTTPVAGVWSTILTIAAAQSPAGCTTTFPNIPNISALDANGNVLTLVATGIINAQTGVRMDNVAPPTAGLIAALAVNGRTGNWINDAVSLNTVTAAANLNGAIAAAVVDLGIGGTISYNVKVSTTYTLAKAAAAVANTSTFAMLATNASYCAIVYTADLLGNTQGNPGGTCAVPAASAVASFVSLRRPERDHDRHYPVQRPLCDA